jgi:hypothetical protein
MGPKRWSAALVVGLLLLFTTGAHAQWILAAHAAKNQINRMTQHSANGGYDVATVVLDANPSNVYDKTLERLKARSDLKITKQDKDMGTIEIKKGKQVLGFQIYALGAKETQMIVASGSGKSKDSDATPIVVESIMRVCKEFNVQCTAASPTTTVSTQ